MTEKDDHKNMSDKVSSKMAELTDQCKDKTEIQQLLKQEIEIDTFILNSLKNETSGKTDKQNVIEEIHGYLQAHCAEDHSLDELAAGFHISKSYMMHAFKERYLFTINEYLLKCRMTEAKRLLILTDESLTIIAEKCGFRSVSYFVKIFRREEECTPTEYRKADRTSIYIEENVSNPYHYKERKNLKPLLKINYEE